MSVKVKFNVSELTKFGNGGGGKVVLIPVVGHSDENREFWKHYTPSGKLEMWIDNPEAYKQFEEMGEFYLTIEKA